MRLRAEPHSSALPLSSAVQTPYADALTRPRNVGEPARGVFPRETGQGQGKRDSRCYGLHHETKVVYNGDVKVKLCCHAVGVLVKYADIMTEKTHNK